MIDIYTDGSATEMRSGWAFVIVRKDKIIYKESGLGKIGDTNQAMELTAFLKACEFAQDYYTYEEDATIYSDSAYIINCFKDKWYQTWMSNGWRTSNRMAVKNTDLWKAILKIHRESKNSITILMCSLDPKKPVHIPSKLYPRISQFLI